MKNPIQYSAEFVKLQNEFSASKYFEALVKRNDVTKLKSVTNQLGQRVDYVAHPLYGDVHPVIAMFPEHGVAFNTTFFDCEEFYTDSHWNSCFVDGKHLCAWIV